MKAYRWTGKRLTPGEGTKRSRMKTLTFLLPVFFALAFLATQIAWAQVGKPNAPLDRHALVTRHNVVLTQFNGERPLQVGNGEFAFGMDLTGLQTFAPFNTMSQWGWHSSPLPPGQHPEDFAGQVWDTHGRPVRYPLPDPQCPELSAWLAANPHRINLGRIGLVLTKRDGTPATQSDLRNARQQLDLWNGLVTSRFELEGEPVTVTTACHSTLDTVAVRIASSLVHAGRLAVFLECPGNDPRQFANFVGDWSHPGRLESLSPVQKSACRFRASAGRHPLPHQSGVAENANLRLPLIDLLVPPVLRIVKAEYGAGDKWLDVTAIASKAVQEGRLTLRADNALGADPTPGSGKNTAGRSTHWAQPRRQQRLVRTKSFDSTLPPRRTVFTPAESGR